ncbi:MAG: transcription antitermination factor NusB [Bacteroidaceae bacterium]|nr:transcription antitermination factor NusB [Bacteroidaceae bacterium]
MINRELIRLKLVQITYSYYQNGSKNPAAAEKELLLSLSRAYDLYNSMLLLMVELNRMALRMLEMRQSRAKRLGENAFLSAKFVENRFMHQLESNKQLQKYRENQRFDWADQEEYVRLLYGKIEESEYFKTYMTSGKNSYEEDREIWRLIYRHLICNNEELDSVLEEMDLYWNDDKVIVDTFVLKTINRFTAESTADQPLLPEYKDVSDQEFATCLLQKAIANKDYYYDLIASTTRKWDINRVALMDRIILQLALAEIISFPGIPVSVSINEYVEIAKMYSTSKSGKYINATLDNIAKRLIEENKLIKNS